MKNKGFTLVELLAVMSILVILLIIIFPTVSSIVNNGKETVYDTQINKILNAAYDCTLKKTNKLPDYNETNHIILSELKNGGYIEGSIIDSKTKKEFRNDLVISVKNVGNNYSNKKLKSSSVKGDYLYTVELDFMKTDDFKNNKPTITIDGYEGATRIYNLNIGEKFIDPNYTAISSDNNDITNRVVKSIMHGSNIVDSIDEYNAGIYYVNYCVVDQNGYSNCEVLNVVVIDSETPILKIPENETINTSATSFDLMNGVECIDNSGKCTIKIKGEIEFGKVGSYIIYYHATDPSGNTETERRVITIE